MTRFDHLTYCSVCVNRKFTLDNGFICNLTDRIADFDKNCINFSLDQKERTLRTSIFENEIEQNIKNRDSLIKKVLNDKPVLEFLPIDNSKLQSTNFKEYIIKESFKRKAWMMLIVLLLIFSIIYIVYHDGIKDSGTILGLLFMTGLAIGMLYFILNNAEVLRVGQLGLIIKKKEFIPWYQIDFMHLKTVRHENVDSKYLVIRRTFGDSKEIEISFAESDIIEIGTELIRYKNRFKKN